MVQRLIQGILLVFLVVGLTACGTEAALSNDIVQQAIALQFWQTQQVLSQQLQLAVPEPKQIVIQHVVVTTKSPLTIQERSAYQLQGTYDFTLTQPQRQVTQRNNAFAIYIQSQPEGKTWRLAQRELDEEGHEKWVTQAIAAD